MGLLWGSVVMGLLWSSFVMGLLWASVVMGLLWSSVVMGLLWASVVIVEGSRGWGGLLSHTLALGSDSFLILYSFRLFLRRNPSFFPRSIRKSHLMRHLAVSFFLAGGIFVVYFAATTFEQAVYHSANAATVFENIICGACGVCLIALSFCLVLIDIRTSQLSLLSQCKRSSRKCG
ncbi:hypothetical protein AVEN_256406-1 [Araneus ventricosus]|uniref:Uncharacterized protein n=1 Tax=Araneus ventricosus TaxID=182803 RepID=A0A4Y2G185_ARAVE|nr:hypothetical protein AVEN_256406-1 [Araneus ventricosus]